MGYFRFMYAYSSQLKVGITVNTDWIDLTKCTLPAVYSQPAITCQKLTVETIEQGVKYVQS